MVSEKRLIDAKPLMKDGWHLVKTGKSNVFLASMSLADVPTVDAAEVVHARWVFGELSVMGQPVYCSACGYGKDMVNEAMWLEYPGHKHCGCCGAKMDGERGK